MGIGALLADGIGDTIRVSLSEEPEAEIPVALHLIKYIIGRQGHTMIPATTAKNFDWLRPERRKTVAVDNVGGDKVPVVIASSKANSNDSFTLNPDFIYVGSEMPVNRVEGQKYIVDFNIWKGETDTFPIFPYNALPFVSQCQATIKFVVLPYGAPSEEYIACLKHNPQVVVVSVSNHQNRLGEQRALVHDLMNHGVNNPVVFCQAYKHSQEEKSLFQLESAADMGALMMDGLCDGIWLMNDGSLALTDIVDTSFGILQAARLRTTKTEYISCPGCGRTLYDLLMDIYVDYGFSREFTVNVVKPGKTGADEIKQMLADFRSNPPKDLAGSQITVWKDFQTLEITTAEGTKKLDMPTTSNVLQWFCSDGTKVSVRPSGTEPKIKFYIEVKDDSMKTAADYDRCVEAANAKIEAIKKSLNL